VAQTGGGSGARRLPFGVAPVAQLDRADGFYPSGCAFESCRGRNIQCRHPDCAPVDAHSAPVPRIARPGESTGWGYLRAVTRAVLFDLFGTLIGSGPMEERHAIALRVAADLEVDGPAFAGLVRATFDQRMRGHLGGLTDTYVELSRRLGASPDRQRVERAVATRLGYSRQLLGDTGAAPLLERLRGAGYLLGVVSDCSIETATVWESSWLSRAVDAVSLSCLLGTRKPDPEMYLEVTRALAVDPRHCLYVGDGGSHELSGARALGMDAVLVADPREAGRERIDEEAGWDGDTIISLAEVLVRLGHPPLDGPGPNPPSGQGRA
jgi:putative hydrolase of the HAD superfamily